LTYNVKMKSSFGKSPPWKSMPLPWLRKCRSTSSRRKTPMISRRSLNFLKEKSKIKKSWFRRWKRRDL
jgi:hypothetical protein